MRIDDDHHLSLFFYPLNNTFLAGKITNKEVAKLQISRVILFNEYLQKETWKGKQRMEEYF
jgi:hypothetical protein